LRCSIPTLALFLALSACSKKPDIKGRVSELEKAFPMATPAETSESARPPPVATEAKAYVSAAVSAARANDYASGVMALEQVQRMTGLVGVTANQLMIIEQAKQAMVADLVARADRGDPKAKADLAAIERTHSQ